MRNVKVAPNQTYEYDDVPKRGGWKSMNVELDGLYSDGNGASVGMHGEMDWVRPSPGSVTTYFILRRLPLGL